MSSFNMYTSLPVNLPIKQYQTIKKNFTEMYKLKLKYNKKMNLFILMKNHRPAKSINKFKFKID